jgi:hypothetical protein
VFLLEGFVLAASGNGEIATRLRRGYGGSRQFIGDRFTISRMMRGN